MRLQLDKLTVPKLQRSARDAFGLRGIVSHPDESALANCFRHPMRDELFNLLCRAFVEGTRWLIEQQERWGKLYRAKESDDLNLAT